MLESLEILRDFEAFSMPAIPKMQKKPPIRNLSFKDRDRRRLQEEIERLKKEIESRMDRMAEILKEEGYPDMQTFTRAYNRATDLVKQYNRELAAWERKDSGESDEPIREDPPRRESIRQQIRELEAAAKGRNAQQKPRRRNRDTER